MSASFNDSDGKPLVFQLNGATKWKEAMTALGFYDTLVEAGFADLGVVIGIGRAAARRCSRRSTSSSRPGRATSGSSILREADIVSAPINTLLEASNDPDVLANGYITEVEYPEARQEAEGARLAVAFLRDAAEDRRRAGAGRAQRGGAEGDRLQRRGYPGLPRKESDLGLGGFPGRRALRLCRYRDAQGDRVASAMTTRLRL